MMSVDLDATVARMPTELSEEHLLETWASLATGLDLSPSRGSQALIESARDYSLWSANRLEPSLGGGWKWNLTEGAIRTVCASCLLGALLAALGISGIPPLLIPAVLPLLFDIERVRLERSERNVIRIIGARSGMWQRIGEPEELYRSLPPDIRGALKLDEFEEFLESAGRAGMARKSGTMFEVLPNGQTCLKITLE